MRRGRWACRRAGGQWRGEGRSSMARRRHWAGRSSMAREGEGAGLGDLEAP